MNRFILILRNRNYCTKSSNEIRKTFLNYFQIHNHKLIKSSCLIPQDDHSLLLTNSGMNQFKKIILGQNKEKISFNRAVTSQRCIRAGGKHNDFNHIGFSPHHHTFFEMLGNFSFGDYYKEEAIFLAWTFLIHELKLDVNRLQVSVYYKDEETIQLWKKIAGFQDEKIIRLQQEENFWSMGETGPCGPCTEVFWDKDPLKNKKDKRWLEIWNIVFMQKNRTKENTLIPLEIPCVDTGMGLERISSILQGVSSNYETDLFIKLIEEIKQQIGLKNRFFDSTTTTISLRIIADHFRSSCFLIADNILPGNTGRNYILRKILRRAIISSYRLGQEKPFLFNLLPPLLESLQDIDKLHLLLHEKMIVSTIKKEEKMVYEAIRNGISVLDHLFDKNKIENENQKIIDKQTLFSLHDTYGFPLELTKDLASNKGWKVDEDGFYVKMKEKQLQGQQAWKKQQLEMDQLQSTNQNSFIQESIYKKMESVVSITTILNKSLVAIHPCPFYAQLDDQCGDTGLLRFISTSHEEENKEKENKEKENKEKKNKEKQSKEKVKEWNVIDTVSINGTTYLHLAEEINENHLFNDKFLAQVNKKHRRNSSIHHSATHLLYQSLRELLGFHIEQISSSYFDDKKILFDFTHMKTISQQDLILIEEKVNEYSLSELPIVCEEMKLKEAYRLGALSQFGKKYGERVQVVSIGDISKEFCSGIHAFNTKEIFPFRILSEKVISKGKRRIEAIAGNACIEWLKKQQTDST